MAICILFPGTYSRKVSFKRIATDAVNVLISLIPIFIVAAFFESYVTHLMSNTFDKDPGNIGLPVPVSLLILAASLFFIIWYFVLYPIRLHKKGVRLVGDTIIKAPAAK